MNKNLNRNFINKEFNTFDSSTSCLFFILYQWVATIIILLIPTVIKSHFIVQELLYVCISSLFFFAGYSSARIRKVDYINASNINKKINAVSALVAIAISFICLFTFGGLTDVFTSILAKLGYVSQNDGGIVVRNVFEYIRCIIKYCVCPAIFEEFLFRGVILSGLKEKGKHKAVCFSALIFMLMHGGPDQTVHQFILGVVLGYAFIYAGSLWVPIIVHFVNNFIAITSVFVATIRFGEVESTVTKLPSWGQIGITAVVSVIMAIAGAYLIYLCINALKKHNQTTQTKQVEQITEQANTDDNQTENKDEEQSSLSQNVAHNLNKQRQTRLTVVCFVLSGLYLILDWVITLIIGF